MTPYQQAVLSIVRTIPNGRVVSYGQIAAYLGTPRGARQVGWTLRSLEGEPDYPWWRVVNNTGRITIKGNGYGTAELQKAHLEAEGVAIRDGCSYTLDMERYRFRPHASQLKVLRLDPEYISTLLAKYGIS